MMVDRWFSSIKSDALLTYAGLTKAAGHMCYVLKRPQGPELLNYHLQATRLLRDRFTHDKDIVNKRTILAVILLVMHSVSFPFR